MSADFADIFFVVFADLSITKFVSCQSQKENDEKHKIIFPVRLFYDEFLFATKIRRHILILTSD